MNRNITITQNSGYTLVEVMISVVIIGVMASLAIPNFNNIIEKTRTSEGFEILTTLLHQQEVYKLETGNGVNYATLLSKLGVTFATIDNFNQPTVANNATALASIVRSTGAYTLTINSSGTISCTPTAGFCTKFGCTLGDGNDCN